MNPNQTKKQNIKIIVSEAFMVIAVIITVIILALLVSGYWLNSNFEIERNGMLQISSIPTGASVEIDGAVSSWLERTNSSKILSSGTHSVKLTKDGYDSWQKDIVIAEGLLYRLHYPRLFLNNRELETITDTSRYANASISSDHNAMLLTSGTTEWVYYNLDSSTPSPKTIDISEVVSSVSLAEGAKVGLFTGEILDYDWDYDASHILLKIRHDESIEWILLDVNNVSKSINLTKEFGTDFTRIEILDNNSNNLLAIQNNNLHKIDVSGRLISAVLVKDVIDFDHFNNEIVFSARNNDTESSEESEPKYDIGYFKVGDRETTVLEQTSHPVKVAIGKFYDSKFIAILNNNMITIHQKDAYDETISSHDITFSPDDIKVGHDGEFLLLTKEKTIATLDFEANLIREWNIEGHYDWLDNDMLYTVSGGDLTVYDFDGLNRRTIAHNVSSHSPVTITNDKWLYYFSDGSLVREWLIAK